MGTSAVIQLAIVHYIYVYCFRLVELLEMLNLWYSFHSSKYELEISDDDSVLAVRKSMNYLSECFGARDT